MQFVFYVVLSLLIFAGTCVSQSPSPSPTVSPTASPTSSPSPSPTQSPPSNNCLSQQQTCEQQAVGGGADNWAENASELLEPMDSDCGSAPGALASFCDKEEYAICLVDAYNPTTLATIFSQASDLQACELSCRSCMNNEGGNADDCAFSIDTIVDSVLEVYENVENAELELPALVDGCDWEEGDTEPNTDCSTLAGRPEPSPPWYIHYYDEPLEYTCDIGDFTFTQSLSLGAITISQFPSGTLYSSTCTLDCTCIWEQNPSATCSSASEDCPTCSPLALGATRLDDEPVTAVGIYADPFSPAQRLEWACQNQATQSCDSLCASSLSAYQAQHPEPVVYTTNCTEWERITPSPSPSPTPSPSPIPSQSSTPSSTPTATPTSTESPSGTATPSPTPTVSPSTTPSPTQSPTPTVSPSTTPSPTQSPTPTVTPSATPSPTQSPTPTVTPSATPSPTQSPTPTVTPSAMPSATPSATPSG